MASSRRHGKKKPDARKKVRQSGPASAGEQGVPSRQLIEQLMEDGQTDRAVALLRQVPVKEQPDWMKWYLGICLTRVFMETTEAAGAFCRADFSPLEEAYGLLRAVETTYSRSEDWPVSVFFCISLLPEHIYEAAPIAARLGRTLKHAWKPLVPIFNASGAGLYSQKQYEALLHFIRENFGLPSVLTMSDPEKDEPAVTLLRCQPGPGHPYQTVISLGSGTARAEKLSGMRGAPPREMLMFFPPDQDLYRLQDGSGIGDRLRSLMVRLNTDSFAGSKDLLRGPAEEFPDMPFRGLMLLPVKEAPVCPMPDGPGVAMTLVLPLLEEEAAMADPDLFIAAGELPPERLTANPDRPLLTQHLEAVHAGTQPVPGDDIDPAVLGRIDQLAAAGDYAGAAALIRRLPQLEHDLSLKLALVNCLLLPHAASDELISTSEASAALEEAYDILTSVDPEEGIRAEQWTTQMQMVLLLLSEHVYEIPELVDRLEKAHCTGPMLPSLKNMFRTITDGSPKFYSREEYGILMRFFRTNFGTPRLLASLANPGIGGPETVFLYCRPSPEHAYVTAVSCGRSIYRGTSRTALSGGSPPDELVIYFPPVRSTGDLTRRGDPSVLLSFLSKLVLVDRSGETSGSVYRLVMHDETSPLCREILFLPMKDVPVCPMPGGPGISMTLVLPLLEEEFHLSDKELAEAASRLPPERLIADRNRPPLLTPDGTAPSASAAGSPRRKKKKSRST